MAFLLFGLTGGIASGKSSVGRRWRERGFQIIDGDILSRRAVEPGSPGLKEIELEFGKEYINHDGTLNRRKLGELVFSDDAKRVRLESILLPRMKEERDRERERIRKDGHRIACYEAAMIVERGDVNEFRPLVVVSAPEEVRIERIIKRDTITKEQAKARIATQATNEVLEKEADYVIHSNQDKKITREIADCILDKICLNHKVDPKVYPR